MPFEAPSQEVPGFLLGNWARDRSRNCKVDGELRDQRGYGTSSFSYQFHCLPQSFDFQFHPLTSASCSKDIQSRNPARFQFIAAMDSQGFVVATDRKRAGYWVT
jgi:hypothetical protein